MLREDTRSGQFSGTRTTRNSRCFETELSHHDQQVGFLQRFREGCKEDIARLVCVYAAVGADSNDWGARVLAVCAFDVPSCTFSVNCKIT